MGLQAGSLHRPAGSRAISPRSWPPQLSGAGGCPPPEDPRPAPRSLGGLPAFFQQSSMMLAPASSANVTGLLESAALIPSKPRRSIGLPSAAHAGRPIGRSRRARHTPARRRPFHARPGDHGGRPSKRGTRLGGRRRHADARASRPEAHHEPGRVGDR
jgi:hypothetical protein